MNLKPDVLQAYANEHCDGDRLRAVHRLLVKDEDVTQVDYLGAMNEQELDFAMLCVEQIGIQTYETKEDYQKVVKLGALHGQLGVTDINPAVPNPFGKMIWTALLSLVLMVAIPIAVICLLGWPLEKLIFLVILLALGNVLRLFATVRVYHLYGKLRKLYLEGIPQQKSTENPSFEACMEAITANQWRTAFWEEAQQAIARCKKRNRKELLMLPLYFVVMVVTMALLCQLGMAGAVVACLVNVAIALWRCSLLLKEEKQAENLIRYTTSSRSRRQLLKTLSKGSWGTYLLIFAYIFLTYAGCYAAFDII